jgi:hypothetical protein
MVPTHRHSRILEIIVQPLKLIQFRIPDPQPRLLARKHKNSTHTAVPVDTRVGAGPSDQPILQHWRRARPRATLPWVNRCGTTCDSCQILELHYLLFYTSTRCIATSESRSHQHFPVSSECHSLFCPPTCSASLFNSERTSGW